MRRTFRNALLTMPKSLLLTVGMVALNSQAWAQGGPSGPPTAAPAATPDNADDVDADTIVVTAQRRSERLQDVPISITALDAQKLQTAGVEQLSDLNTITPGLQFEQQGGFSQPTIRGVGTSNEVGGAGTNVGVYVDGFLLPNPGTNDMQLLNVTSVQVLKGPQGTLFGRNTTGGAILLTTSGPSHDTDLRAEVSYGSYDAKSVQAYATTGIGDKLAVDIAALYREGDGYIRNVATGKRAGRYHGFSVRAGAKLDVTDNFSLLLRYTHSETNDPGRAAYGVLCCNSQGRPYSAAAYVPGAAIGTRPNQVSFDAPPSYKPKVDAVQLTAAWDLGFAKLTSYTQYREDSQSQSLDLDGSSAAFAAFAFGYKDKYFTQELLLTSSPGGPLQWVAGIYYFSDYAYDYNNGSFGGSPYAFFNNNNVHVQSLAGYVDGTYQVTPKLFVSAGLRVSHDRYADAYDDLGAFLQASYGVSRIDFTPINDTEVTPRFALRYALTQDSSVYATFTRGYKSSLRDIGAYSDSLIKPERLSAYEVGYKLGGSAFSVNLSAYYYDYKNLQVQSFLDATTAHVQNAAKSRIYGLEGDVRYKLGEQLELTAAAAYTNAKYKSFKGAPRYEQCLDPSCGMNFGSFPNESADLHNSTMHFAPKFSGNIGARYSTDLSGGELTLSSILSYTSKQYLDLSEQFTGRGHEDLALRAQWVDPSKHYTFAVFAQNVTNRRYRTEFVGNANALLSSFNAPRTVGGSVGFNF